MSVPGAPTITSITPGNSQLSVAFTSGSGTVTNYKFSTNNGSLRGLLEVRRQRRLHWLLQD